MGLVLETIDEHRTHKHIVFQEKPLVVAGARIHTDKRVCIGRRVAECCDLKTEIGDGVRSIHGLFSLKETIGIKPIFVSKDEEIKEGDEYLKPIYKEAIRVGYEIKIATKEDLENNGYMNNLEDCVKIIALPENISESILQEIAYGIILALTRSILYI